MPAACPAFLAALDPGLCRAVDHYCERTAATWDAEPVNAATNLAFLIAGWAAWRLFTRTRRPGDDPLLATTIGLIPAVGLGSFTFHTLATRWAEWVDVLPILAFMAVYLWLAMTRFFAWPTWLRSLLLAAFVLATLGLEAGIPGRVLWGGAMYVPSVAVFLAMGATAPRWSESARRPLLAAVAVFLASFTFRTLDEPTCATLPFGTHFLWHVLNAVLLFLLVRLAILHDRPAPATGAP